MRCAPRGVAIGLAIVTAVTSACTTYHPRASRFIVRDADRIHHRDGQDFDVGTSGNTAESLVNGNPRALEYVRRYKHLNRVGFPLYLLGLAAMIASPFAAAAVPERAETATVLGAFGLGFGITIAGIVLMFKGDAALIDAVNAYNDDVANPTREGQP